MKNRLMIVRGEKSIHSEQDIQELYHFLTLVDGNYRNAIYVECADGQGYMLTMELFVPAPLLTFNVVAPTVAGLLTSA